jgi:putative Mg2+ transporter-C (MgtC) family protein
VGDGCHGAACGAGLPLLALVVTAGHFLVVLGFSPLMRRLPRSRFAPPSVELSYEDGKGLLRAILAGVTGRGFTVASLATSTPRDPDRAGKRKKEVGVVLELRGRGSVDELVAALSEIDGVLAVKTADTNNVGE